LSCELSCSCLVVVLWNSSKPATPPASQPARQPASQPVCQSVSLSACQSVSLSVRPSVRLSVCLSVSSLCRSVRLSVCLAPCLSVSASIRRSVCLCLCLCLSFCLPPPVNTGLPDVHKKQPPNSTRLSQDPIDNLLSHNFLQTAGPHFWKPFLHPLPKFQCWGRPG